MSDDEQSPQERFELTTAHATAHIKQILDKYAWWSQPDQLELVKQKFLSGELSSGHPHWRSMHIRPVGYYGKCICPRFACSDHHALGGLLVRQEREEYQRRGKEIPTSSRFRMEHHDINPDEFDINFHLYAFDIIDGAGRAYPLLMEYRFDVDPDAPRYVASGQLLNRRTYEYMGSIESSDEGSSTLTFDYDNGKACRCFYGWTPHSDEAMAKYNDEDAYYDIYDELKPMMELPAAATTGSYGHQPWFDAWLNAPYEFACRARQDGLKYDESAKEYSGDYSEEDVRIPTIGHTQVQQIVAASLKLLDSVRRHPESASMWTAFHPPAIREMFAQLALERSMRDMAATLAAEPVPVPGTTQCHASAAAPATDSAAVTVSADGPSLSLSVSLSVSVSPSDSPADVTTSTSDVTGDATAASTSSTTTSGSDSTLPAAAASPSTASDSAQPAVSNSSRSPLRRYGPGESDEDFLFDLPFVPMDPKRFVGSTDNGNGTLVLTAAATVSDSDADAAVAAASASVTDSASDASASASSMSGTVTAAALDFVDAAGERFRLDIVVCGEDY